MRTIKTGVALVLSYLVVIPLQYVLPGLYPLLAGQNGPFYTCIAAIICMQNSVGKSVHQGISRLISTAIGGGVGLIVLTSDTWLSNPIFFSLMLGGGTVLVIWLCNVIRRPESCSLGAVVFCVILFYHTGPERYLYAVSRMLETVVGVLIAILVNRFLPDHRAEKRQAEPSREEEHKEK